MGWTKNRDKLHEAAISTIRAISKNKQISSNNKGYPPAQTLHGGRSDKEVVPVNNIRR